MSAALQVRMTVDEFLDWENQQELKYEFDGFEPLAMSGGTETHATLQHNLHLAIGTRLRGKPCRFYGSDLKIAVAGSIRYPDGFVTCAPRQGDATVARDPVVIFEVLSDSSAKTDFVVKNREYAATPSVHRYVILAQDEMLATMFERVGDDWVGHVLDGDDVLSMPEIEVDVPITELYDGVTFPRPTGVEASP